MMKDIPSLRVTNLAIAIVPRQDEEDLWDVYIINFKEEPIGSVFVNSRGYGELEGEKIRTTTLRHFFEQIAPLEMKQIEPIQMELFGLTNEYWVSFMYNGDMYDKKYVFVKGSIDKMHFTRIPFLDRKGVMIK
ncbi:MAG: hypothetical protein AB8G86_08540 [Saprospiraceae bacterium]